MEQQVWSLLPDNYLRSFMSHGVKSHEFHRERRNRAESPQPGDPGERIGYPTFQGGRQFVLSPASVVEARFAVARLARSRPSH